VIQSFLCLAPNALLIKIEHNSDSFNNKEPRQSIIQLVRIPEIETFYTKLGMIFEIQIPIQPTHITLYTTFADKRGISINTQSEFDEYSYGEIKLGELSDC
jgi:hypothetical protein